MVPQGDAWFEHTKHLFIGWKFQGLEIILTLAAMKRPSCDLFLDKKMIWMKLNKGIVIID